MPRDILQLLNNIYLTYKANIQF